MQPANDNIPLAEDILRGAAAIAEFMGSPRRAIYHLVAKGNLPVFRMGDIVCARRSTLTAWIDAQEFGRPGGRVMAVSGRASQSESRALKERDRREASTAFLATLDAVGVEIRSRLELADKALGKAEDHYRAAGLQLIEVKKRIAADGQDTEGAATFEVFLKQHCIGRSRAYDMIAIADGRKTLEGIRARAAERKRLERTKSSDVRDVTDKIAIESDVGDIESIKAKLKRAEEREKETKSKLGAQKSLADIASKQRKDALTEAMFLRADIERLTAELEQEKADKTVRAVIEPRPAKEYAIKEVCDLLDAMPDDWRLEVIRRYSSDDPFSVAVSAYDALPPNDRLRFHEARPWPALRLVAA